MNSAQEIKLEDSVAMFHTLVSAMPYESDDDIELQALGVKSALELLPAGERQEAFLAMRALAARRGASGWRACLLAGVPMPETREPTDNVTAAVALTLLRELGAAQGQERDEMLSSIIGQMALMSPATCERYRGVLMDNGVRAGYIDAELKRRRVGPTPDTSIEKRKPANRPTDDELRDRFTSSGSLLAYGLGDWRRYTAGVWPAVNAALVKAEIAGVLEQAKPEGIRPTSALLSSVLELTRVKVFVQDQAWDADADVLVCQNGTLHIPTATLREHSPDDHATTALPYAYDPEAKPAVFKWALQTTVPDAAGFLQEFAGYALTTDTRLEIAVWLCGPPASGKSTLLTGLQAMLGERAGVLGLADVERNRFALADLPGKTLMVAMEQPALYMNSTHILNAIISGEALTVDRKWRDPITVVPRCKLAWAMNDLPRVNDANNGLFRRVKVIRFPALSDPDPEVKERIKEEGAGILNWALEGLARLRQRGRFDIPACVQDATRDFQETNDKPLLFVSECCDTGPEHRIQSSALYQAYKEWCYDNGFKAESSARLAEEWRRLGFARYRAAGKSWWRGVQLALGSGKL